MNAQAASVLAQSDFDGSVSEGRGAEIFDAVLVGLCARTARGDEPDRLSRGMPRQSEDVRDARPSA